jgi:hypothetical protein
MSKMLRACVLVIAIACSVQAGHMQNGIASQTPDAAGEIQNGLSGEMQCGLAGDMPFGLTSQSPDAGTEILMALLSLF